MRPASPLCYPVHRVLLPPGLQEALMPPSPALQGEMGWIAIVGKHLRAARVVLTRKRHGDERLPRPC